MSNLHETFTDWDHAGGSKSVKVSSKSDKPFPRYCHQKLAERNDRKYLNIFGRFFRATSGGDISETVWTMHVGQNL